MTPELAYFLKINVGIIVFYIFYRLFFYKDTFFHWRRTALLCFLGVSLFYPMLNLQEWVKAHEPMVVIADLYATTLLPEVVFEETITPTPKYHLFLRSDITIYPFYNATDQYYPLTNSVQSNRDTRCTCTDIKQSKWPLFLFPLDICPS